MLCSPPESFFLTAPTTSAVAGRETQIDAGRATNSPTDVKPTDPAHFLCRDPSTASWRANRPVRICIIEIRARLCAKSARSEAKPDHKLGGGGQTKLQDFAPAVTAAEQLCDLFCKMRQLRCSVSLPAPEIPPNSTRYRNIALGNNTRETRKDITTSAPWCQTWCAS